MGRRGTFGDAFECLKQAGGVWGHFIDSKHQFAIDW
jgi:hypothetical protein